MSGNKRNKDRATAAFRLWARAGCPGSDEIKDISGAEDLRACVVVFAELASPSRRKNDAGEEIVRAVEMVYMAEPKKALRRADLTMRVRRAAFLLHADERTVYRWLSIARRMWAEVRFKTCQ